MVLHGRRTSAHWLFYSYPASSPSATSGSGYQWPLYYWPTSSAESTMLQRTRILGIWSYPKLRRWSHASKLIETAPLPGDLSPVDHSMISSLQRQIERLLRERRLRLANKLIDKLNLGLQGGSVTPEVALSLDGVRAQVAKLFPPAGTGDTFSAAQIQLAQ